MHRSFGELELLCVEGAPGVPPVVMAGGDYLAQRDHPWRRWATARGAPQAVLIGPRHYTFPRAAMARAAAAIDAWSGNPERWGLGNSMAGHAVIAHSQLLRLQRIIAISPPYSPDPHLVPGDPRTAHATTGMPPSRFRGMRLDLHGGPGGAACWALYDPRHEAEALQRGHAARVPGLVTLPVPYLGHDAVALLDDTAMLETLFDAAGRGDLPRAHAALRQRKKNKFTYVVRLADQAARAGHRSWAAGLMQRAEKLGYTTASRGFDTMLSLYLRQGDLEMADRLFQRAYARGRRNAALMVCGMRLRLHQGRLAEACALSAEASARHPGNDGVAAMAAALARASAAPCAELGGDQPIALAS